MTSLPRLLREQGRRCHYCGGPVLYSILPGRSNLDDMATRDHRIPLSRGGTDHPDNIVIACRRCNSRKGNRTDVEYEALLLDIENARLDAEWAAKHPDQMDDPDA